MASLSSSPIAVSHPRYLLTRPGRSASSADSTSLDGKARPCRGHAEKDYVVERLTKAGSEARLFLF